MRLHLVTNMIIGNKPLVVTIRVHTIRPRINVSREYAAPWRLVVVARTYTHVRIRMRIIRALRRFILQRTCHGVPPTPRDLQTTAVRPSINLFNPIIRILCVRHRSRIGDGDREPRVTLGDDRRRKL